MKKITVLLFCILIISISYAQKRKQFILGSYVGSISSIGVANIMNSNIKNDNSIDDGSISFLKSWGGRAGLIFIGKKPKWVFPSVYGEYKRNYFKKSYTNIMYEPSSANFYNKEINYKTNDISLIFRVVKIIKQKPRSRKTKMYNFKPKLYFDLGAKITTFNTVTENNISFPDSLNNNLFINNTIDNYKSNYKSIVAGIGFWGRIFELGIQFSYSLDNMMLENKYTLSDGVYDNPAINTDFENKYNTYAPTKMFSVELTLGINLYLLNFTRRSCGGMGFQLGFNPTTSRYW